MATTEDIQRKLRELAQATASFSNAVTEGELHQLSFKLAALDNDLREGIQLGTTDGMAAIIIKLDSDQEITAGELELIRLWMLSDAEYYIQLENDLPNWIAELERLFSELKAHSTHELSSDAMGKASGAVRDALRVISDVEFFRAQELRIKRFEAATETITTENKQHLSRLLKQKLRSPKQ
jgi:hypothetical protein